MFRCQEEIINDRIERIIKKAEEAAALGNLDREEIEDALETFYRLLAVNN